MHILPKHFPGEAEVLNGYLAAGSTQVPHNTGCGIGLFAPLATDTAALATRLSRSSSASIIQRLLTSINKEALFLCHVSKLALDTYTKQGWWLDYIITKLFVRELRTENNTSL